MVVLLTADATYKSRLLVDAVAKKVATVRILHLPQDAFREEYAKK